MTQEDRLNTVYYRDLQTHGCLRRNPSQDADINNRLLWTDARSCGLPESLFVANNNEGGQLPQIEYNPERGLCINAWGNGNQSGTWVSLFNCSDRGSNSRFTIDNLLRQEGMGLRVGRGVDANQSDDPNNRRNVVLMGADNGYEYARRASPLAMTRVNFWRGRVPAPPDARQGATVGPSYYIVANTLPLPAVLTVVPVQTDFGYDYTAEFAPYTGGSVQRFSVEIPGNTQQPNSGFGQRSTFARLRSVRYPNFVLTRDGRNLQFRPDVRIGELTDTIQLWSVPRLFSATNDSTCLLPCVPAQISYPGDTYGTATIVRDNNVLWIGAATNKQYQWVSSNFAPIVQNNMISLEPSSGTAGINTVLTAYGIPGNVTVTFTVDDEALRPLNSDTNQFQTDPNPDTTNTTTLPRTRFILNQTVVPELAFRIPDSLDEGTYTITARWSGGAFSAPFYVEPLGSGAPARVPTSNTNNNTSNTNTTTTGASSTNADIQQNTTNNTTSTQQSNTKEQQMSNGEIAGIVAGSIIGIVLIVVLVAVALKKKKTNDDNEQQ